MTRVYVAWDGVYTPANGTNQPPGNRANGEQMREVNTCVGCGSFHPIEIKTPAITASTVMVPTCCGTDRKVHVEDLRCFAKMPSGGLGYDKDHASMDARIDARWEPANVETITDRRVTS